VTPEPEESGEPGAQWIHGFRQDSDRSADVAAAAWPVAGDKLTLGLVDEGCAHPRRQAPARFQHPSFHRDLPEARRCISI